MQTSQLPSDKLLQCAAQVCISHGKDTATGADDHAERTNNELTQWRITATMKAAECGVLLQIKCKSNAPLPYQQLNGNASDGDCALLSRDRQPSSP